MKGRRVAELFPPVLKKLWNISVLRVLVLISLTIQIILIIFGERRKSSNRTWLSILLRCSYLLADWVATVALGVISKNLGDFINHNGAPMGPDMQLNAFWAPFLLLHLGGPDTITAYALEDNELWLRHLLGLGVQTGVTFYIFVMAWMGSRLSFLFIPMIVAGLIKHGERTWVLGTASNEQFRDSMLTDPDPGPNYHKFMEEYTLRQGGDKELKDEPGGDKRPKGESSNDKEMKGKQSGDKELKAESSQVKEQKEISSKGIELNKRFANNDRELKGEAKRKQKEMSDSEQKPIEPLTKEEELNKKPANEKLNKKSSRDGFQSGVNLVQEQFDHPSLKWSTDGEFDRNILIWHIATDICYHVDSRGSSDPNLPKECDMSKQLSDYLLYLLIMHPTMLPMGIGNIRYRDTCAEGAQFFKQRYSIIGPGQNNIKISQRVLNCIMGCVGIKRKLFEKEKACKTLLKVNTVVPPSKVKGERSKSVLFDACRLASELQDISDRSEKWKKVSKVWVEMLAYAASQCRGTYHAKQLRRGGELLTHVWLLMAHWGLTDQFQITLGHARAKLAVQ